MSVHRWLTHTHSKLHHCYSSLPRYTKQPLVTLGCTYLPSKWKPIRGAHPLSGCTAGDEGKHFWSAASPTPTKTQQNTQTPRAQYVQEQDTPRLISAGAQRT